VERAAADERRHTLEDLRRIVRRIERTRPPRSAPEPVEDVVGGELVDTGHGTIALVRRIYPLSHRHGRGTLDGALRATLEVLGLLASAEEPPVDASRPLFLDAETTGLAGGTGTYAFLVGAGWIEGDRFVVAQHFMRDLDDEPALLAGLRPLLEQATLVVTFNGRGFDLPLLETRYVLARARWPRLPHLDLLPASRRVWSACLPDCRLATLERDVLGLVREQDVPGFEIPSRYFSFLRHKNPAPLVPVFDHNRDDVLSLAALLGWFAGALSGGSRAPLSAGELAGVGRLWERLDIERSVACYEAALGAGLTGPAASRVRLRLAWWEKRRARWERARALWERATRDETFDPRPWEELAKLHEHRRRDVAAAHGVVTTALELARGAREPGRVLEALGHRLDRLQRRLRAPGRRRRLPVGEGDDVKDVGLGTHPGTGGERGRGGLGGVDAMT
jgi:hypothetical protein